jgi:hypothetical protein
MLTSLQYKCVNKQTRWVRVRSGFKVRVRGLQRSPRTRTRTSEKLCKLPLAVQWQDTKLHARGGCCPAAVAGYQTACARDCPAVVSGYQTASSSKGRANLQQQQQQQQQSKMYTRGASQALAGKKCRRPVISLIIAAGLWPVVKRYGNNNNNIKAKSRPLCHCMQRCCTFDPPPNL